MKHIPILIALLLALSLLFGCADAPEVTESTLQPSEQSTQEIVDEEVPEAEVSFDFAPSDAYGTLYPFVGWLDEDIKGTFAEGNYELAHDVVNVVRYGLVDGNGEIVVEPIYYAVEPVRHDYYSSGEQIQMWKLYIEPLGDPHFPETR